MIVEKAILIDGSGLIYKCFFSLPPQEDLKNEDMKRKFLNLLVFQTKKWIKMNKYFYGAIVFDIDRKSFRTELLPEYKAQRDPMPPELVSWIPEAISKLSDLGIKVIFAPKGYEADDLIGTISNKLSELEIKVDIFSGDRDFLQLVNHLISIYRIKKGFQLEINNHSNFSENNEGLLPFQFPLLKALAGDSADNYPGIPSIGPKTAIKLLDQFKTENIFLSSTSQIEDEKLRNKIVENIEKIKLFLKIAKIKIDMEFKLELSDFVIKQ